MKVKNKFILIFLSITLLLMFTIVYASEDKFGVSDTSITLFYVDDFENENDARNVVTINETEEETVTTSVDMIEYDVVYTVTTVDNITSLNASFTVTNNETGAESPLLIAAIYDDGRLVNMQTAQPTITSGATVNEAVSITIPNDKTESYYIKLFAWEGTGSLRPLGKYKTVNDIDSYLREKLIYVTVAENTEFKIFMNASTAKGGDGDVIHTIEYDTTKVVAIDLCGFTYEKELSAVEMPNSNIVIESVDSENGIIKYKFLNDSGRNTGINNIIKFKALTSITDAEIKYTIQ